MNKLSKEYAEEWIRKRVLVITQSPDSKFGVKINGGDLDKFLSDYATEVVRDLTERIDLLIEDYRRKKAECENILENSLSMNPTLNVDINARIQTKAAEYRAFITELERLK